MRNGRPSLFIDMRFAASDGRMPGDTSPGGETARAGSASRYLHLGVENRISTATGAPRPRASSVRMLARGRRLTLLFHQA
jgi:hypothetical protein